MILSHQVQSIFFISTHFLIAVFSGKLPKHINMALIKSIATNHMSGTMLGIWQTVFFTSHSTLNCLIVCSPLMQMSFAQWYQGVSGQGGPNLKSVWTQSPCYFTIHYELRKRFSCQCLWLHLQEGEREERKKENWERKHLQGSFKKIVSPTQE